MQTNEIRDLVESVGVGSNLTAKVADVATRLGCSDATLWRHLTSESPRETTILKALKALNEVKIMNADTFEMARRQMEQSKPLLEAAQRQIEQSKPLLEAARRQMEQPSPRLEEAMKQMEQTSPRLEEAMKQMEESKPLFEAARKQIEESKPQFDRAMAQLAQLQGISNKR